MIKKKKRKKKNIYCIHVPAGAHASALFVPGFGLTSGCAPDISSALPPGRPRSRPPSASVSVSFQRVLHWFLRLRPGSLVLPPPDLVCQRPCVSSPGKPRLLGHGEAKALLSRVLQWPTISPVFAAVRTRQAVTTGPLAKLVITNPAISNC